MDGPVSIFVFESLLKRNGYTLSLDEEVFSIVKSVRSTTLGPYKIGMVIMLVCGVVALIAGLFVPAGILFFTAIPLAIRMNSLSGINSSANKEIRVTSQYLEITNSQEESQTLGEEWYDSIQGESVKGEDLSVGYIFTKNEDGEHVRLLEIFGENEKRVLDDLGVILRFLHQIRTDQTT